MGLLGAIGTGVGAFFGGPTGALIGSIAGGGLDASLAGDATNRQNAAEAQPIVTGKQIGRAHV